jgi:hypothetical protein
MDASEARDHLQWIDGIVRAADRSLHFPPATLIAWGLFGAIVNAVHQARASGIEVPSDGALQLPMMIAAIAVSVWAASRQPVGRKTLVDSHAGTVFSVVFAVLLAVNMAAQDTIVPLRAMALFWCVGFSIAMLVTGIQASRPLWVGGLIMVAAGIAASLAPAWFDGILALGWTLGFVGPGVVLALEGSDGRAAAV